MKVVVDFEELKNFLDYLNDKTDEVYESEVKQSIGRFLEEVISLDRKDRKK